MCSVPRGLLLNELAVVYEPNVSLPMFGSRLERRGKAADVTATGDAIGPERDVLIRGLALLPTPQFSLRVAPRFRALAVVANGPREGAVRHPCGSILIATAPREWGRWGSRGAALTPRPLA